MSPAGPPRIVFCKKDPGRAPDPAADLRNAFGDRAAGRQGPPGRIGGGRSLDPARRLPASPAQQLMTPLLVAPPPTFTVQEVVPVEIEPFDTVAAKPLAPVMTAV